MSRYRVGVNAGPVHVSRRVGGKKMGFWTALLVWFTVKPLEWAVRGTVHVVKAANPRKTLEPPPSAFAPAGWYQTQHGPLYFNGRVWIRPDGRPF